MKCRICGEEHERKSDFCSKICWQKNSRKNGNGKKTGLKYRESDKGRETIRKNVDIYQKSIKGKIMIKKYNESESRKIALKKYTSSDKGKRTKQKTRLMREYGLKIEEFDMMLLEQDGKCKICGSSEKRNRMISIDHNHISGKIRGLLCDDCNNMLGRARDNPLILAKSIRYLRGEL